MKTWKIVHYVAIFVFSIGAALGGYVAGIVLADPPLDMSTQQGMLLQIVSNAVYEEIGQKPVQVTPLGGAEPLFGSLSGDVLKTQPAERHYLVNLKDQSQLKSSLIEGMEDLPHGNIDFLKLVEVDAEGETKVLDVRI